MRASVLFMLMLTISAGCGDDNPKMDEEVVVPNPNEINCNTDFGDPHVSAYVLPFRVGRTFENIQTYCPPNPNWGHHNWFAYDFNTRIGDTIVAARAGKVIFIDQQWTDANRTPGEENFIFIEHDDGTVASYVHLTKNGVLVGIDRRVVQGEPIGLSGDTGNSAGPHLHFAVFRDRTNFDRQSTLPVNFRNADGPLDANQGLVQNGRYEALPY